MWSGSPTAAAALMCGKCDVSLSVLGPSGSHSPGQSMPELVLHCWKRKVLLLVLLQVWRFSESCCVSTGQAVPPESGLCSQNETDLVWGRTLVSNVILVVVA